MIRRPFVRITASLRRCFRRRTVASRPAGWNSQVATISATRAFQSKFIASLPLADYLCTCGAGERLGLDVLVIFEHQVFFGATLFDGDDIELVDRARCDCQDFIPVGVTRPASNIEDGNEEPGSGPILCEEILDTLLIAFQDEFGDKPAPKARYHAPKLVEVVAQSPLFECLADLRTASDADDDAVTVLHQIPDPVDERRRHK